MPQSTQHLKSNGYNILKGDTYTLISYMLSLNPSFVYINVVAKRNNIK
ncbi:hypothetical protein VAE122_2890325 [Vibrio aestuarianus]|nr:hypothetical protein VAE122_2890325 [Vibrio aestuarianus]